jgi:hypothetical protein
MSSLKSQFFLELTIFSGVSKDQLLSRLAHLEAVVNPFFRKADFFLIAELPMGSQMDARAGRVPPPWHGTQPAELPGKFLLTDKLSINVLCLEDQVESSLR